MDVSWAPELLMVCLIGAVAWFIRQSFGQITVGLDRLTERMTRTETSAALNTQALSHLKELVSDLSDRVDDIPAPRRRKRDID